MQKLLCGPFEAEHPRGTKPTFRTPKRCNKHHRHFCMGVPPPPLGSQLASLLCYSTHSLQKMAKSATYSAINQIILHFTDKHDWVIDNNSTPTSRCKNILFGAITRSKARIQNQWLVCKNMDLYSTRIMSLGVGYKVGTWILISMAWINKN